MLTFITVAIDCDSLTDPENGVVVTTTVTADSLTASYSCDSGYELVGEMMRDCNCQRTGGQWTGTAPSCRGKYRAYFVCVIM